MCVFTTHFLVCVYLIAIASVFSCLIPFGSLYLVAPGDHRVAPERNELILSGGVETFVVT